MKVIIYRIDPPLRKLCFSWSEALRQGDKLWRDSVLVAVIISGTTFMYEPRERDFLLRQVVLDPGWYAQLQRKIAVKREDLLALSRFIVRAIRNYVIASRLAQVYDNRILQRHVDEAVTSFVRERRRQAKSMEVDLNH